MSLCARSESTASPTATASAMVTVRRTQLRLSAWSWRRRAGEGARGKCCRQRHDGKGPESRSGQRRRHEEALQGVARKRALAAAGSRPPCAGLPLDAHLGDDEALELARARGGRSRPSKRVESTFGTLAARTSWKREPRGGAELPPVHKPLLPAFAVLSISSWHKLPTTSPLWLGGKVFCSHVRRPEPALRVDVDNVAFRPINRL